ncbi:hypothetical protein SB771_35415, partial [Burkholderia sp. SIMBA_051]
MKRDGDGKYRVDTVNMRTKLLVHTVVDEAGRALFDGDADVRELAGKSSAAIERLFTVAQRLNGLAADSVENAEKNSVSGPSDVS